MPESPLASLFPEEVNLALIDLTESFYKDNQQYYSLFHAVYQLQTIVRDQQQTINLLTRLVRETHGDNAVLRQEFTNLEVNVESAVWQFQLNILTEPSMATVLKKAVALHLKVSESQLMFYNELVSPGRQPSNFKTDNELRAEAAQNWLLLLLRHTMNIPLTRVRQAFPWVTTTRYENAGDLRREIMRNRQHKNAADMILLLRLARHIAEEMNMGAEYVSLLEDRASILEL